MLTAVINDTIYKLLLQVNEMKDSATQIEEELDKTKHQMHRHKMELAKMKDQISRMDNTDPNYVSLSMNNYTPLKFFLI